MNVFIRSKRAFTIVELAIVISVILVMVALLVPIISEASSESNVVSAIDECRDVYYNYKTECLDNKVKMIDGMVFIDGEYQYVSLDDEMMDITYLGTLKDNNSESDGWFLENRSHILLLGVNKEFDNEFYDYLYLLDFGKEIYDVYSYETENGNYIFFVNEMYKISVSTSKISVYDCPIAFYENKDINPLNYSDFMNEKCADIMCDSSLLRNEGILGYEKYNLSISNDGKELDIVMKKAYEEDELSKYKFIDKNKETISEYSSVDSKNIKIDIEKVIDAINGNDNVVLYIE